MIYAIKGECGLDILKKIVTRVSIEEVLKEEIERRVLKYKELYYVYKKSKIEIG